MFRNRFNLKHDVDGVSFCKNGFLIQVIKQFLPPSSSLVHEIYHKFRFQTKQGPFLKWEKRSLSVAMWWSDEAWLNIYIYHSLLSEQMWQGFSKVSPWRDKMEKFVRWLSSDKMTWESWTGKALVQLRFHGFSFRRLYTKLRWSNSSLGSEWCSSGILSTSSNHKFLYSNHLSSRLGNTFRHVLLGKSVLRMVRTRHTSIPDKVQVQIHVFWYLLATFYVVYYHVLLVVSILYLSFIPYEN